MKVPPARADAFCARPDPAIGAVLLYGPDQGLVAERRRRLVAAVLDDPTDPFRFAGLEAERVAAAPGLLVEEAQALSLVGGRRVVVLRQATDALTDALQSLLAMGGHEALVVVEAGELNAGSRLRRLAERSDRMAAIPCYREEGAALEGHVRRVLRDSGLVADAAATAFLAAHLGGNREATRGELEKLVLFKGEDSDGRVSLADVEAVVSDSAALGIDRLVQAALVGRPADAFTLAERLLGEGQAAVRLVRSIAAVALRALPLAIRVAHGESPAALVEGLRPPVHFSQKPMLQQVLLSWTVERLEAAMAAATAAELLMKRAASPDRLLLMRHLLDLARIRGDVGQQQAGHAPPNG